MSKNSSGGMLNWLLPIGSSEAKVLALEDREKAANHLVAGRLASLAGTLVVAMPTALDLLVIHDHSPIGLGLKLAAVLIGTAMSTAGIYEASNMHNALNAVKVQATSPQA